MSVMLTPKWKQVSGNRVGFFCPACQDIHIIDTTRWLFTIKNEKGTIQPSVLVKSGHYADSYKQEDGCWCTYNAEHPEEKDNYKCGICHSFVADDTISFLNDCTHDLAGHSVPLQDFPNQN